MTRPPARPLPLLKIGCLFAVAYIAIQLPLAYQELVEPDSVRMSVGIANAIRSGEGLDARNLYGRTFSFAYYQLFFSLYPRISDGLDQLVPTMNALSLAAAAATFLPLSVWVGLLFGSGVAAAVCALLLGTPVFFELGGYGHPEPVAFLLLNLALALFLIAVRRGRGIALLVLATGLGFLAAAFRADVVLAFPLFPLLGPIAARAGDASAPGDGRRAFVMGTLVAAIAVVAFLVVQQAVVRMIPPRVVPVPGGTTTGEVALGAFFLEYWETAKQARSMLKGTAVWVTGLGPVLLAVGWLGVLAATLIRRWRGLALAAWGTLIPAMIFWLPDPTPSRHMLMTFLVLIPGAVLLAKELVSPRRFALVIALLLFANLAGMALLYPVVVRNYSFHFVSLLPRRVSLWVPMGDPITNRIWVRRQVALEGAWARDLARSGESKLLVIGGPTTLRLLHELVARSPAYTLDYQWRYDSLLYQVETPGSSYLIYEYADPIQTTPQDLLDRIAAAGDLTDHTIALVPADEPVGYPASTPPGYRSFAFVPPPGIPLRWPAP